jgi:hypothetical protein
MSQIRISPGSAAAVRASRHKLEPHQVARGVARDARLVVSLYKNDPPLPRAENDQRVITDDGRRWLAEHPVS